MRVKKNKISLSIWAVASVIYDQYFYKRNISLVYLIVTSPFRCGYEL